MTASKPLSGSGYSPAHITGFFTIHKSDDPLRSGSTGAGICISGGVRSEVTASESSRPGVSLVCNGRAASSPTCESVLSQLLPHLRYSIKVKMESILPANYGYGISASSALSLALAVNEALGLGLAPRELGSIAHVAEVENMTGLGDVIAEMVGGLEVRVAPGAPGVGVAKQVPIERDTVVVSTPVTEYPTNKMITDPIFVERINGFGARALESFLESPTLENFMVQSRRFWEGVGVVGGSILSVLRRYERAGIAVPSAKKGIVFAVLDRDELPRAINRLAGRGQPQGFEGALWMEGGLRVIISEIHRSGVEWGSD